MCWERYIEVEQDTAQPTRQTQPSDVSLEETMPEPPAVVLTEPAATS